MTGRHVRHIVDVGVPDATSDELESLPLDEVEAADPNLASPTYRQWDFRPHDEG